MSQTVTVKNVTFGEGHPKIAIPLTAPDLSGLEKALAPWRQCLEEFPWLTTFPEVPDARKARSMCHAWSASPVYFLLKCGLA